MRVAVVRAESEDGKKHTCKWKGCPGAIHTHKFEYPDTGVTHRDTFEGAWNRPPWSRILPFTHSKFQAGKKKKWRTSKSDNYPYQRHHIMPVNIMEECENLTHNLKLLGWNLNNGDYNGICLPMWDEDVVWHDLPSHRGSHPIYDGLVRKRFTKLDAASTKYCQKQDGVGEQDKLWDDINTTIKIVKEQIEDWKLKPVASVLRNPVLTGTYFKKK